MDWREFRDLSAKKDECYYLIGLDMGDDSSGIAFYNAAEGQPEVIDLSGGYGKPSIPTVMQYISETKEWAFGEYAVLNRGMGTEITLSGLMQRLGKFDYIDVNGESMGVAAILALFIGEMLGSVKNINPKAEIVGVVATVPAYFSEQAHEEFQEAFSIAGYGSQLIALVSDRECVLANHYRVPPTEQERLLLLDFGSRELRGGLYDVKPETDRILAASMSSVFDDEISTKKINDDVQVLFESFVISQGVKQKQLNEHISAFTYQHKDLLFQKNITQKPIKLYFNFAYPPFQHTVDNSRAKSLIKPYATRFNKFIKAVLEKSLYETPARPTDIDTVICVGGGFEMLWAKEAVCGLFSKKQVKFYRNSKMAAAEGAALIAAKAVGVIDQPQLVAEDKHQLTGDIGIAAEGVFLPLVERNSFWWQKHTPKLVLVNAEVDGGISFRLEERKEASTPRSLGEVALKGLTKRPKGTTRLEFAVSFTSNTELIVTVSDRGFGDLFPAVDYRMQIDFNL